VNRSVWVAVSVYAIVMTALGIDRYVTYHSGEDLGVFVQAIADAAHGMHDQGELGSHFSHHFSPILYLCAPFLLIAHSPTALIAIQACAGALTAPAIYLLARRHVDERLSTTAAIVTLLYPPLIGVTFTDFHENGFAPAVLAWLLYAVDARRFGLAAIFAILALAIKEDQAYILLLLGAGYAVWSAVHKDKAGAIFGASLSLASAFVLILFFAIILPLSGAAGLNWFVFANYLTTIHGTATGWTAVFGRLTYLIEAFAPLLFLPLRSPWVLLALPGFVELLSSRWPITYTMGQHYAGVWIAYVLAAFVMALANIAQKNRRLAQSLATWCIGICVAVNIVASPAHWGHFLGWRTSHERALDRTLALIPTGASAGSVDEIFVHMSLNPKAQAGYNGALDYLVVDSTYDSQGWRDVFRPQLQRHLALNRYHLVSSDDGVLLYRAMPMFTVP
jgi:uncharacterized membrane protein